MTRILVVEDEPNLALGLEGDLKLEGYDVAVAPDGPTALELAADRPFNLVILDVMLPGKDGFEVCREMRRRGSSAIILMLTARTHESDKVLGLEIGADDYMTKPFSPRELRARVKAHLRRNGTGAPERYAFGDIVVDFGRCELRRSQEVVDITPIELKLLATFVRHRGRVLPREQVLDAVWGTGTFVTDRVVDTHVTNLRRKIEPDPRTPRFIVSVRGIGYRFDG